VWETAGTRVNAGLCGGGKKHSQTEGKKKGANFPGWRETSRNEGADYESVQSAGTTHIKKRRENSDTKGLKNVTIWGKKRPRGVLWLTCL